MPRPPEFPRLTRRDVERILDVHQQLNRARDVLEREGRPSTRAVSALIMSALVLLSELYNRAERPFLIRTDPSTAPSLENGQAELPAAPGETLEVEMTTVVHKQE